MLLGHIRSKILEKREQGQKNEMGVFEMPVSVDLSKVQRSGAPWSYCAKEIAVHLVQAMVDTKLPRDLFVFEPSQKAQKMFNLPPQMPLA